MKRLLNILLMGVFLSTDLSMAEEYATGLIVPPDAQYGVPFLSWPSGAYELPEKLDLREEGLITGVKNQGSCGSCWAFAGAAVMESAVLKSSSGTFDLSEQELVSCDRSASGCSGGWQPFNYMVKNGIGLEENFPYQARNLSCKKIPAATKALQWGNIGAPDRKPTVDEARKALNEFGGLWVTVAANGNWRGVGGGAIDRCSNSQINHAVTLAGYEAVASPAPTQEKDTQYKFLVKNSWGTKWGGEGYVKTPLGCNNLGRHMSFVVPADHVCTPPDFGLPKSVKVKSRLEPVRAAGLELARLDYTWRKGGETIEHRGPIRLLDSKTADIIVTTHNDCGTWTQMVRVSTK